MKIAMSYDPEQIANTGKSFLIAADRCFEQRPLPGGKYQMPAVPAIVCTAFGIELCLKAIIAMESRKATGHEILKLFNKLSPQSKSALSLATSLSEHDLRQKVGSISSAFVDWRYIYEKKYASIDLEFLKGFAQATRSHLEKMANKSFKADA